MSDALLVLNAGSSSLKFSVFLDEDPPRPLLRGQIEGLMTSPRFAARDAGNPDRRTGVAGRHAARPSGRNRVPLRVGPERRARRPPHRRRRPSRRPWRHAVRGAGARRCRGDRGAGSVDSACPAPPAAQRRRDHGGGADGAGGRAGRLLRYGVSPDAAGPGAGLCLAPPLCRRGSAPLRLSWPVLRIHRVGPCGQRSSCRGRAHRGRTPGQRRQHVRAARPAGVSPRPWASRRWMV